MDRPEPARLDVRRHELPDPADAGEDAALVARIRDEIAAHGPMPFARFMDLALYDPDGGYYRAADARPGRGGDFVTAPELHPIFGATLASAVLETWERLGRPDPFVVIEHGAGEGALAVPLLETLATTPIAARPPLPPDRRRRPTHGHARRSADHGRAGHLLDDVAVAGASARCGWSAPSRRRGPRARQRDPRRPAGPSRPPARRPPGRARCGGRRRRSPDRGGDRADDRRTRRATRGRGHRARRRPDRGDLPRPGRVARDGGPAPRSRTRAAHRLRLSRRSSCTTRSAVATGRCAPTSARRSTTIRTAMSGGRT